MNSRVTCAEAQAIVDEQLARGCKEIVLPETILLGQAESLHIAGSGLTISGGMFIRVGNETTE